MMLGMLLAAASAGALFHGPTVTGTKQLDDYFPQDEAFMSRRGVVTITVVVGKDGKPVTCGVNDSSGEKNFDLSACAAAFMAIRYKPALDQDGQPIYGVIFRQMVFTYGSEGRRRGPTGPQVDLSVAKMPPGLSDPSIIVADVLVDKAGKIEQCRAEPSEGAAILGPVACQQIVAGWRPYNVVAAGEQQRSVQVVRVTFSARPQ